jgi:hypothetical protein
MGLKVFFRNALSPSSELKIMKTAAANASKTLIYVDQTTHLLSRRQYRPEDSTFHKTVSSTR